MNKVYKYAGLLGICANLAWTPISLGAELHSGFQMAVVQDNVGRSQEESRKGMNPTQQQNTTPGGGTRDFAPVNEGAREENEGGYGNPNIDPKTDPKSIDKADFNDPDEGFDGTLVMILLLVGLGLGAMLLVANRRRFPTDAQKRP